MLNNELNEDNEFKPIIDYCDVSKCPNCTIDPDTKLAYCHDGSLCTLDNKCNFKLNNKLTGNDKYNIDFMCSVKIPFGKHKGNMVKELMKGSSIQYLVWVLNEGFTRGLIRVALLTLEYQIRNDHAAYMANKNSEEHRLHVPTGSYYETDFGISENPDDDMLFDVYQGVIPNT